MTFSKCQELREVKYYNEARGGQLYKLFIAGDLSAPICKASSNDREGLFTSKPCQIWTVMLYSSWMEMMKKYCNDVNRYFILLNIYVCCFLKWHFDCVSLYLSSLLGWQNSYRTWYFTICFLSLLSLGPVFGLQANLSKCNLYSTVLVVSWYTSHINPESLPSWFLCWGGLHITIFCLLIKLR